MSSPFWSPRSCVAFLLPLAVLFSASVLLGDSLALLPVADTTLYGTLPDYNLGGVATLIAGTTFLGQSNRALLRFDMGLIPGNASIESVTLSRQGWHK